MTEDPERERKIALIKGLLQRGLEAAEREHIKAMEAFEKEWAANVLSWRGKPDDNKTD